MKLKNMAKELGRRGGRARARKLSTEQKVKIASLGGSTRAQSFLLAKRIRENFAYFEIVQTLAPKRSQVSRVSVVRNKLPEIGVREKK